MVCIHGLKPGFKPDGQSDANEEANNVAEGFIEYDDDGCPNAHGFLMVGLTGRVVWEG